VPTPNEICEALRLAMPGGKVLQDSSSFWDPMTRTTRKLPPEFSKISFEIEPHKILLRADGDFWAGEWRAGAAHSGWKHPGNKTPLLDTCVFQTGDDVIGWASWLRDQMVKMAAGAICAQIQPGNLFPDGGLKTARKLMQIPLKTLEDCGLRVGGDTHAVLLPPLRPFLPWKAKDKKHAMMVSAAGRGAVVGRIVEHTFMQATWDLEWRVKIPLDRVLDERGTYVFRAQPTEQEIQEYLSYQYIKVVLAYAYKAIEDRRW
jgi:hypothetical protein